jgi:hypothetical protein
VQQGAHLGANQDDHADTADRGAVTDRHALPLLALGALLFYAWSAFPPEHQAQVWNALGAAARAALLLSLVWGSRSRFVWLVVAWWLLEEAMVAGCSVLYIFHPWTVRPGDAQCSALLEFDLGKVGAVAMICLAIIARPRRG